MLAEYFSTLGNYLIVEHCSENDSQVKILNQHKKLADDQLNYDVFEENFLKFYEFIDSFSLKAGDRRLYLLKRRANYDLN
jgi:hypothetical protein